MVYVCPKCGLRVPIRDDDQKAVALKCPTCKRKMQPES